MFNKGALSILKIGKELNKDEMYALGHINGMKNAFFNVVKKNINDENFTDEQVNEIVSDVVSYDDFKEVWDTLRAEYELELMDYDDLNNIIEGVLE